GAGGATRRRAAAPGRIAPPMKAVPAPLVVALSLLAGPAAAEPDVCQDGGTTSWVVRMSNRSDEIAPSAPTQAGIDALGGRKAGGISLQQLRGGTRTCPVADFSALSRVGGLTAIDDLPTECLAAFARTAKLPALRSIGVMCGDGTAIDLQKLLEYPGLEAVRFVFGCQTGPAGLAP